MDTIESPVEDPSTTVPNDDTSTEIFIGQAAPPDLAVETNSDHPASTIGLSDGSDLDDEPSTQDSDDYADSDDEASMPDSEGEITTIQRSPVQMMSTISATSHSYTMLAVNSKDSTAFPLFELPPEVVRMVFDLFKKGHNGTKRGDLYDFKMRNRLRRLCKSVSIGFGFDEEFWATTTFVLPCFAISELSILDFMYFLQDHPVDRIAKIRRIAILEEDGVYNQDFSNWDGEPYTEEIEPKLELVHREILSPWFKKLALERVTVEREKHTDYWHEKLWSKDSRDGMRLFPEDDEQYLRRSDVWRTFEERALHTWTTSFNSCMQTTFPYQYANYSALHPDEDPAKEPEVLDWNVRLVLERKNKVTDEDVNIAISAMIKYRQAHAAKGWEISESSSRRRFRRNIISKD